MTAESTDLNKSTDLNVSTDLNRNFNYFDSTAKNENEQKTNFPDKEDPSLFRLTQPRPPSPNIDSYDKEDSPPLAATESDTSLVVKECNSKEDVSTEGTSPSSSPSLGRSNGKLNGYEIPVIHSYGKSSSPGIETEKTIDSYEDGSDYRHFQIHGLLFPGKWMYDELFLGVLHQSESFKLCFEKAAEGYRKPGHVKLIFPSENDARHAFAIAYKMTTADPTLKIRASKQFYDDFLPTTTIKHSSPVHHPALPFDVDVSHVDASRSLYALHLTPSTDQTLLSSIIGSDSIEAIRLEQDPNVPNEKQAQIVFRSKEDADDARVELAEGFEVDEGDRQFTMRLITGEEYLSHMQNGAAQHKILSPVKSLSPIKSTSLASTISLERSGDAVIPCSSTSSYTITSADSAGSYLPAPELTVEDVTSFMQKYVDDTRTNWAELTVVDELWKLCDEVSRQHNGIPDSLLKPALLCVLEGHQFNLPGHWMRQHVDELIKMWKREVQNTKWMPRETAYQMSAPRYTPPRFVSKQGMNEQRRHMLTSMMGVGAMLNCARSKLATEEGELEIDEDEYGNFTIDGQALSFESWAKITQVSAPKVEEQPIGVLLPEGRKVRIQHKKEIREKKLEEEKIKKMKESVEVQPTVDIEMEPTATAVEENFPEELEAPEKKRELEEGEMSSDSSHSSSSSSSSSDDENLPHIPRTRRRKRGITKQSERMDRMGSAGGGAPDPRIMAMFSQMYQSRHGIVKGLSNMNKHTLASVLNQITSSPSDTTTSQNDMINRFINNFPTQTLTSK